MEMNPIQTTFNSSSSVEKMMQGYLTGSEKKTDKYTSADMQNKVVKVMAMQVLREVVSALQNAVYYTVMVDETTDVSNREQVVLCFCWVDNDFNIHEDFVGMYTVESIDADTLVSVNEQS